MWLNERERESPVAALRADSVGDRVSSSSKPKCIV